MGNVLDALSHYLPAICAFYVAWCLNVLNFIYTFLVELPWGMVAERKRAIARVQKKRAEGFDFWAEKVNNADEITLHEYERITKLSLDDLRSALQAEELTPTMALLAYVHKAFQIQKKLNPITEIISDAFDRAAELHETWKGKDNKPYLYGVPFSVKSNFHLVGYDCHIGLGKMLEMPLKRENSMVTHLKHLGAVPFCLTNVPQGLLSFVCSNAVFGTTGNPHDPARTPGGSSGGEGCIVTAGGTPFGTGSDVAGSLRIPAAMCGCVALKVGQERFVVLNSHGGVPGRGRLGLGFGYFTNNVHDQVTLLKQSLGHPYFCEISPKTPSVPLDLEVVNSTRPLRIGYFDFDGFMPVVPAMKRAVNESVENLRRLGHEMVKFTVPEPQKLALLVFKNVLPDGGEYTRKLYEADVVDEYMTEFVRLLSLPRFVKRLLSLIAKPFSSQAAILCASQVSDLTDLRQTQEDTDEYIQSFTEYWQQLGIDALVCPSFPAPAVKHEWPSKLGTFAVTTTLFNLLDYPAGVVPVGTVTKADDDALKDPNVFPVDYNLALHFMRAAAKHCEGLPISVQVAALPYKEEICLRVMADIEKTAHYAH